MSRAILAARNSVTDPNFFAVHTISASFSFVSPLTTTSRGYSLCACRVRVKLEMDGSLEGEVLIGGVMRDALTILRHRRDERFTVEGRQRWGGSARLVCSYLRRTYLLIFKSLALH